MELQNIENSLDALEANLKNKPHLVDLELGWGMCNWNPDDSTKAGDVIEKLQPSKHLKKLSIMNFGGKQFPNWLLDNSLSNMVSLVLENCQSCQRLPPLGLLPFLKDLKIEHLDGIVSIDADFHGNNSSSFKSLEILEFFCMKKWEKWECQVVIGAFPHLQFLSIRNCPKLKGHLPEQLVPLKNLEIRDCQKLEASAPRALDLYLEDCGKLQFDWVSLKYLSILGHNLEAWLVEMVGHIVSPTSIEFLNIYFSRDCQISDGFDSLRTFLLDFFPKLKRLGLRGLGNLQIISQSHTLNHLEYLAIRDCPQLESLSGNMHMLLPSLTELYINDCPRLESFPGKSLPPNLKDISLVNCSRFIGSLKGAFGDNPSLETLEIRNLDAESCPDEGLVPLSLTSLSIYDFPNLKKLDYKGICQLSSLKKLLIENCPNLQHFPEEGLPKSISHLTLSGYCPFLRKRCQKQGGEDWPKIAHIQNLNIT